MSDEEHLKVSSQELDENHHLSEDHSEVEPVSDDEGIERGIRKVTMYSPDFGGQELGSAEDLREVIEREVPGLEEHRNFEKMMGQCVNHFKAIERFGHRERVSSAELREFAEEIDEPEKTVRAWVVEGASPLMYPTLESAMTKEEAQEKISEIRERLEGVDSFERLQERLDHPYHDAHTKTQVSHPKDLESARKYYEFLDEMEKGGTIADASKRVGIRQSSGSKYLEGRVSRLIKTAIEPIPDFEVVREGRKTRIDTLQKYEEALRRHPFVRDLPDFKELDHEARVFAELLEKKTRGELPDEMVKDLARKNNVGKQRLASWLSERKTQELIRRLEIYDRARETHEAKLAPEAFEHRIDPSDVYQHFRHLKDTKEHSPEDLAAAIERMYRESPHESRMQWAELRPYHTGGPRWLRDIASSIEQNREEVETEFNKRISRESNPDERMRMGLVDSKLYIRRQDTNEYNWMNIYRNELMHFRSIDEKIAFVKETRDRLGIQGNRRLSQLVEQITDRENITNTKHGGPVYDLTNPAGHLRGYSLGMMLDTKDQQIQDIKSMIAGVGKKTHEQYGIRNPQFPEGQEKIDSMYASVLGAGFSDGHIERSNDGFVYTEKNRARVEIVNKQVDQFGDVYRHEQMKERDVIATRYNSSFGRLLENRGLTKGDKTLQNEGWPDWLKEVSPEVLAKYYEALWAEDGSFIACQKGQRAKFSVDRGTVLRDPNRNEEYGTKNKASEMMAKLVCDYGDKTEDGPFGGLYKLSAGRLKELEKNPEVHISQVAQQLRKIVENNKPKLMIDEQEGLEKLGIKTREYFLNLTYSDKTERLSALWGYQTRTKDDAMSVAFQCPPDDEVKRAKVEKWMWSESESERRERIKREIGGLNNEL